VIAAGAHQVAYRKTNWLRDGILGGQDGLVNILGIVLSVIAAAVRIPFFSPLPFDRRAGGAKPAPGSEWAAAGT
jgi:hypothetical protein